MFELLRGIGRFLRAMDAKTITSLAVSVILLAFVILMFLYGQQWLRLNEGEELELLSRAAQSPWAVVGVITIFSLLALTAFPQILLFTATIIVFGPRDGAIYSWIATMVSATLTFGLGHFLGGRWVLRLGGERAQRSIDFLGRHGVLASGLVRLVPTGPFIVVNAAAGAAHIPIWKFWAGTGLGIMPKIALVAVLGLMAPDDQVFREGVGGLLDFFLKRNPEDLAVVALVITLWLALLVVVRMIYQRVRRRENAY